MQVDKWTTMYINGKLRHVTQGSTSNAREDLLGGRFFADADDLPCRRCSQHHLDNGALAHMCAGGVVITSGNRYSFKPPKEQP